MLRLANKNVIISGAGGFLGTGFVKAVLREGGRVVAIDVSTDSLDKLKGSIGANESSRMLALCVDIANEDLVAEGLETLPEDFQPNCLVNNAAVNPTVENSGLRGNRIENISKDRWDSEFDVGLWGAFVLARAFGMAVAKRNAPGLIINIGSDYAHLAPKQSLYQSSFEAEGAALKPATYSVLKHGVIGLTRYLATYWTKDSIRALTFSPGGVENGQPTDFLHRIAGEIPLGRMATRDQIADVLVFLLSDEAQYFNGTEVVVDGGRQIW